MDRNLTRLRARLNRLLAARQAARSNLLAEQQALDRAALRLGATTTAQKVMQEIAAAFQERAHAQVAGIVSKCLSAVFREAYELKIEFTRQRGQTQARFVYYKAGKAVNPRLTSGGVLNVAGLALRLASLLLRQPRPPLVLVLDEPFTGVDVKNLPRVAALLQSLAGEPGVQFVVVSHREELEAGKVVRLG